MRRICVYIQSFILANVNIQPASSDPHPICRRTPVNRTWSGPDVGLNWCIVAVYQLLVRLQVCESAVFVNVFQVMCDNSFTVLASFPPSWMAVINVWRVQRGCPSEPLKNICNKEKKRLFVTSDKSCLKQQSWNELLCSWDCFWKDHVMNLITEAL